MTNAPLCALAHLMNALLAGFFELTALFSAILAFLSSCDIILMFETFRLQIYKKVCKLRAVCALKVQKGGGSAAFCHFRQPKQCDSLLLRDYLFPIYDANTLLCCAHPPAVQCIYLVCSVVDAAVHIIYGFNYPNAKGCDTSKRRPRALRILRNIPAPGSTLPFSMREIYDLLVPTR